MNGELSYMKIRAIESSDYISIVDIYNYYVKNSNAAFAEKSIDVKFVKSLHNSALTDSFLVLDNGEKVVGFDLLKKFLPHENFSRTATITYFISPEFTRCGLGSSLINSLINYGNKCNIDNFIAEISSDNLSSINFHKKQGFQLCGILNNVGFKNNNDLSVIYMQKCIKSTHEIL